MKELSQVTKMLIESVLYWKVKLIVESQYNIEEVADTNKNNLTKIIFKDKKHTFRLASEAINEFALEHNLNINDVKNYLLQIIEKDIELNSMYKLEYEAIKEFVLTQSIQEKEEDTREI